MAYRLKSVRYQNAPCKILLQNENGPCPLLAATNALLLRGAITLPSSCIRNGVASIDDVVNILANRALKRANDQVISEKQTREFHGDKKAILDEEKSKIVVQSLLQQSNQEHHVHELLSLFPNLQYGMDVNPKFSCGPTGIEYTQNLIAFDLMGVELVHGWLLDPQDVETAALIGNKSYNQLVELVVAGSDAASQAEVLEDEIKRLQAFLDTCKVATYSEVDDKHVAIEAEDCVGEEWTDVVSGVSGLNLEQKVEEVGDNNQNTAEKLLHDASVDHNTDGLGKCRTSSDEEYVKVASEKHDIDAEANLSLPNQDIDFDRVIAFEGKGNLDVNLSSSEQAPLEQEAKGLSEFSTMPISPEKQAKFEQKLVDLSSKHQEQKLLASNGSIINNFLTSTGHQLTYHGLYELQKYLEENCMCVFFRNNHFATMTKQNGVLYLLVTDLGYANVPEVMWEKLDVIDGDTEHADELFSKPIPRATVDAAPGPTLSPEQVLAQSGFVEADFQLALQLSKMGGEKQTQNNLDEEEGNLIAAATEASLKEWNGIGSADGHSAQLMSDRSLRKSERSEEVRNETRATTKLSTSHANDSTQSLSELDITHAMEEADRALALQLQAQFETDDRLVRRMQAEEDRYAAAVRSGAAANNRTGTSSNDGSKYGCILS